MVGRPDACGFTLTRLSKNVLAACMRSAGNPIMPYAPFSFDAGKATPAPMLRRRVVHITTMTVLLVALVWVVILATMRQAHQLAAN